MKFHVKLYMMVIQNLAKKVMIRDKDGRHAYISYKPFKRLLFQNHQADMADILQETLKAPPYIK